MWYIITFCIGGIIGFAIAAIMASSGYSDKIQEAYNCGCKHGKGRESY